MRQNVASLPTLLEAVTLYSTMYALMCHTLNVVTSQNLPEFASFCDHAVYCVARTIKFFKKNKFKNVVNVLSNFYTTKNIMVCTGKYLEGSEAEHVLIETDIFGVNVTDQIL